MNTIYAKDFNIKPNEDITESLAKLNKHLSSVDGEKTVVFEKGTYYIDFEKCEKYTLFITNTVGDKEFSKDETPHINAVPFYFNSVSNVIYDCNDAVFVIDGKVTNVAMENCENITVKNMEIRHAHPDMHELKVIGKTLFTVDFQIDEDSEYRVENKKLYFSGKDYDNCCDAKALNANWIGLIQKNTPDKLERVFHPLHLSTKVVDLGNRKIRAYYTNTFRFKIDDLFYYYDVRRQFAGIFANKCKDVVLDNIKQRFNYSLALVVQDSENITLQNSDFSPEKGSKRKMASVADFIQMCMCRGDLVVKNNYFDGAGDDCLNVHGIHFEIKNINGNELTVRFMHPQTHGFNPLRVGDKIAYINSDTLLEEGTAVIEKSELINEYDIKLTVDSTSGAKLNNAIEDISACPNLEFVDNTMTRIITRGILITTRGKVNVKNNHFISTSMSSILLSDDAKNWYESGMCTDVTIQDNTVEYCGGIPILIKPENRKHLGAVHKNINICGNVFKNYKGAPVNAKSTDNILIENNKFVSGGKVKTVNCNNVKID